MATAPPYVELQAHLTRWSRWARLRAAFCWTPRGAIGGLAVGVGLALVARLQPVWDVRQLTLYAALAVLVGAVLAAVGAYLWPRPALAAARAFDRALGLAERTSTALELAESPSRAPAQLAARQLDDAVHAARRVSVRRQLPLRVARNELLLALVLLALLVAGIAFPNEQLAALIQQRAVQGAIEEQAAALEEIRADIRADESLTEAQRQELLAPLEQSVRALEAGDLTQEQAVSVLAETEQQLRELSNPQQLLEQAQGLQQAGAQLAESELTRAAGEALQNGDLAAAAEALRSVDPASLDPAQQQQLADQLEAAAADLEASSPDLARDLQQAADALREGDAAAAAQALERAAGQLDALAAQQAQAQAAQQAAAQVQQAQQAVAQAGQQQPNQGGESNAQGQGAQQGQLGQPGQGQQQSSQGSESQAQGSSAAGRGESDAQAQGGQAGAQPIGENAPGDAGERAYEPIYAPQRLGGHGGPEVQLAGSGEPGDEILAERPITPDERGNATVPYNEIFPAYNEEAHRAVEAGEVPVGLRPVVRQYFENLEPRK